MTRPATVVLRLVDLELALLTSHPDYAHWISLRQAIDDEADSTMADRSARELSTTLLPVVPRHLQGGAVTLDQAELSLKHSATTIRACGLDALGRLAAHDDRAAEVLFTLVASGAGKDSVFGPISLAYIAVANLIRAGSPRSKALARQLLESQLLGDEVLRIFLGGEGLTIGP